MLSSHVNKPGMCAMCMCLSLRRWPHRPGEWLPTLDISLLPPAGAVELLLATCLANAVININITRPKPAYGWQGLAGLWGQNTDQAGTFWDALNVSLCASRAQLEYELTWKTNLETLITCKTDLEPKITMKDQPGTTNKHKNWPGTMKDQLGTMKDQPGTMKNHENRHGTMKNQPRIMKTIKTHLEP